MPTWLKPSYIVILVTLSLLGIQTYRLANAQLDVAHAATASAQLEAGIATQRAAGVEEGRRQQEAAHAAVDAKAAGIQAALERDNLELTKHYNLTYEMLRDLAAQDKWACLRQPLPESVLQEFRR